MANRLDFIAEQLDPHWIFGIGGKQIEDAAVHAEFATDLRSPARARTRDRPASAAIHRYRAIRPHADRGASLLSSPPAGHRLQQGRENCYHDSRRLGRRHSSQHAQPASVNRVANAQFAAEESPTRGRFPVLCPENRTHRRQNRRRRRSAADTTSRVRSVLAANAAAASAHDEPQAPSTAALSPRARAAATSAKPSMRSSLGTRSVRPVATSSARRDHRTNCICPFEFENDDWFLSESIRPLECIAPNGQNGD